MSAGASRPNLEFKQELSLGRDSQKSEAEHDVQGLANAGGGHVIYGIAEGDADDGSKVAGALVFAACLGGGSERVPSTTGRCGRRGPDPG